MKGFSPSPRFALAAVVGITALVWAPALWGGFVWDDINNLVANDRLASWSALAEVFLRPAMWSADTDAGVVPTWRPLALASFILDRQLFGPEPFGYHLSSLLWHLGATAVVFAIFCHAFSTLRAAILTLIFSLHPAAAEAVAWINGRSEIFALLGGGGAIALAQRGISARRAPAFALLLAIALMAKETGLIFVPLAVLVAFGAPRARKSRILIAAALATGAVLALRMYAAPMPGLGPTLSAVLPALPSVFYRALQATLVPTDLGITTLGPWISGLTEGEKMLHSGIALALALAVPVLRLRKRRQAALGLVWWLAALLPASLLAPLGWPGLQRWLYLALPGLLLAVGSLPVKGRGRYAVAGLLGLLVLQTERAIHTWSSEEKLYIQTLEEDPNSGLALANLGALLLSREQFAEAETLLRKASAVWPPQGGVGGHLARALARMDRCDEAQAVLKADPEQGQGRAKAEQRVAECYARRRP